MTERKKFLAISYRDLLEVFKDAYTIHVTISVWTYRSKRKQFIIPLSSTYSHFDNDLNFTYKDKDFVFETVEGKQHKFHYTDLKTVKVDHIELIPPLDYINVSIVSDNGEERNNK
ncbi:hypothetical protein BSP36_242 [Bacillus phage BSP36]|nr:hypothetical protein BSP36_242 [Bacillus phage BSP36]